MIINVLRKNADEVLYQEKFEKEDGKYKQENEGEDNAALEGIFSLFGRRIGVGIEFARQAVDMQGMRFVVNYQTNFPNRKENLATGQFVEVDINGGELLVFSGDLSINLGL